MARPVVHFEITGRDPEALRRWFGELFAWDFDEPSTVAEGISDPGRYHFTAPEGGIPGGVAGGPGYTPGTLFYVAVDDVEAALARAEELGGRRVFGPAAAPSGLVVGHLADPEGNVVGLAALPV
ncbi:VOC family protein [Actinomycetospora aeridis]|uniref:VOC family protein n=1 Tax=Actinomycetospora aeridis TaxID=3129231 RepID=A0ABU8MYS1_9PSEU